MKSMARILRNRGPKGTRDELPRAKGSRLAAAVQRSSAQRVSGSNVHREALTAAQRAFLEIYIANGGNGTRAYLATHPNAQRNTAASNASRMLRNARIASELARRRAEVFAKHQLDADEALCLIAMVAAADLLDAYGDDGTLLPLHQWPENLRLAVKEVRADGTIKLLDVLKARELIAIRWCRIQRAVGIHHFDHAGYLTGAAKPRLETP